MLELNKFYDLCYNNERRFIGYVVKTETDKYGVSTHILLNSEGYLTITDWDYTRFMVVGALFQKWQT